MRSKKFSALVLSLLILSIGYTQNSSSYQVVKTFHINSDGWWDYLAVNGNGLYVSHGTKVNILDKTTGDSTGFIPNTAGVHGIAFDNETGRGYTSNGRANNVTVFDLKTGAVLDSIATGENPDAILYEPYSKTIITCNGRSKNLTVIDAKTGKVTATIPVGGKPETAVSNGTGKLYVNIEDKSEIVVVNIQSFKVEHHWPIAPGEAPTGLAIDKSTKRLFAGCDNKLLMVIDAAAGKVISHLPLATAATAWRLMQKKMIYTSNGEGTLTAIQETSPNNFKVLGNFPTKRGARTIALDEATGLIYLPTADFEATAAGSTGRPKMLPGTFQVLVVQP